MCSNDRFHVHVRRLPETRENKNNKEKEIIAVAAVDKLPRFSELSETIPRWEQCINEAFITQSWLEAVGMMSGLKELFLNNLSFIRDKITQKTDNGVDRL